MGKFECDFCGAVKYSQVFSAFDFDQSEELFELRQCSQCGLTQTWPTPDESKLDLYYSRSYYGNGPKKFSGFIEYLTILACKSRAKEIIKHLSKKMRKSPQVRVLDIGCGRANLLSELVKSGVECFGIEREKYPPGRNKPNISIYHESLEERQFDSSFFDAVVIWHVLEHLHQPAAILDEVARITDEGGLVAIAVPNFSSFQSRLFKAKWFHLDLPRHLYHFDTAILKKTLTQRGYVVQSVSTCSFEQNVFGFIQSFMNSFKLFGTPNSFYQLLKHRSGFKQSLRLALFILFALLIFPLSLLEFGLACIFKQGASVIIFAHKT